MELILSMSRNTIYEPSSVKPKEAAPVQEPEKEPEKESEQKSLNALQDMYSPEKTPEASGRYWMEPDETGQPKIHFDDPEKKSPDKSDKPGEPDKADEPDKKAKTESCTGDTGKVDREIKRLKQQKETLTQQLRTETNETKIKELERKLKQVHAELRQKDNDTYRRQHTVFS